VNCKIVGHEVKKDLLARICQGQVPISNIVVQVEVSSLSLFLGVEGLSGTFVGGSVSGVEGGLRSGVAMVIEAASGVERKPITAVHANLDAAPPPSFDTQRQNHRKIEAVSLAPTVLFFL
jgi:hypothetical protein